ncbi:MAG: hypothetical protein V1897_19760 [Pseudomonadota bacterium]
MSKPQLEQITEARASYLYVEHVFTESANGWASMRDVILKYIKNSTDVIARVSNPEAILTFAVLGHNLDSITNYSPLFKDKHDQAARIEEWILFSLLTDFRDRSPWSPEESLLKVRKYQQLDATLIEELKLTGKNPFGDLTGAFLCELFGNEVEKLYQEGTNWLNHFLFTFLADIFTITCSSSFSYWKTAYGKYEIVSGGLSVPTGTENTPPATQFNDRLKGKPDGSYIYHGPDGAERMGWMPPDQLSSILEGTGCQKLTHVLIRDPSDRVREDFWPLDNDIVTKLADIEGTVYVVSHLESGELIYYFVSKRAWDNYDRMFEVMNNPSLSDEQRKVAMKKIMED